MDNYINRFLEFRMKVNWNNVIPVEYVVFKFIQGLKSQIILLVYAGNLMIINTAITIVKHVKGRLNMTNRNK